MTAIGRARPVDRSAGRAVLLGALLIALLAMHVLSGHDTAGHHRVLTPIAAEAGAHTDSGPLDTWATPADAPTHDHHAIIVAGAVLLVAAAVVALAGALRRQRTKRLRGLWSSPAGGLCGPPPALSRRALCVERI